MTADEGRALHNLMLSNNAGASPEAAGLNCFSPNVNLFRDPRWGRGQETFGEDPLLVSSIGLAYTRGLQEGEDHNYLKIAACAKHYAVHSGPEEARLQFTATISLRDFYDTYAPAFRTQAVGAQVAQIMPALSGLAIPGHSDPAPDDSNKFLLRTVLRNEWKRPHISVISDNAAVGQVCTTHHYAPSLVAAAGDCMDAGTDLDLGPEDTYSLYLESAICLGSVSEEAARSAAWRSFYLRIRLGDFDPPSLVHYQSIDSTHLNTPANQKLNLLAACESIVLLKNANKTLPLSPLMLRKGLSVIGPSANDTQVLLSSYEGIPATTVSVLSGLKTALGQEQVPVSYVPGCEDAACNTTVGFSKAVKAASDSDMVVMVLGLTQVQEGEAHDRKSTSCQGEEQDVLALPGCQSKLVQAVVGTGKPVILVLLNGGPLSLPGILSNPGVAAVVEAFYPGALGGAAVADVLLGVYNPGGKMPVTVFSDSSDLSPSTDYNMTASPGRTYRYFTGKPQIPFGFGLSYTVFRWSRLAVNKPELQPCESLVLSVTLSNVGQFSGDEVIQIYLLPPLPPKGEIFPKVQLVEFDRQTLAANQSQNLVYEIDPYRLSLVAQDGVHYIFPGQYQLSVGDRSPGVAEVGSDSNLIAVFKIAGNQTAVSSCTKAPSCLGC